MKIGVALSGCDIGGVGAYGVLEELLEQGFEIGMVSATGTAAVAALPYAHRLGPQAMRRLMGRFLDVRGETDTDMAVAELAAALPLMKREALLPLAVSAVNLADGKICTFTDLYTLYTDRLVTYPLEDVYDVLSAAVSPLDGLGSYPYRGYRLCDFSVWHGSPLHPLNMAGVEKTISVAFVPRQPKTPHEVLVKNKLAASAGLSDIHITIEQDTAAVPPEQFVEIAAGKVKSCMDEICVKISF